MCVLWFLYLYKGAGSMVNFKSSINIIQLFDVLGIYYGLRTEL